MSTELWLDYLGILLDSRKAEGLGFTINLVTPDNGEQLRARAEQFHADQHPGRTRRRTRT